MIHRTPQTLFPTSQGVALVVGLALVTLALAVPSSAHAGAADHARKLVDTFKAVKAPPEGAKLSDKDKAANKKTFAELDKLFDFDTFTASCVKTVADKLDPAQSKAVRDDIVGIVRARAYPRGGQIFAEGEVKEGKAGKQGDLQTFDISIYFPKQDLTMDILFVFGGDGRIVDVHLDDDSLTKDFRVQFARFLGKKSAAELVTRLGGKRKEAEKANE